MPRSNGLLHNFLLHIILHGRLLPLSMLLLPIRVSLPHRSILPDCSCILVSCVRSLPRSRARGPGRAGERGSFHVRWELDGLCGIPGDTPRCLPRPGPACSGFSVPRRRAFRGRYPYVKCWLFLIPFYLGHLVCMPLSRPLHPKSVPTCEVPTHFESRCKVPLCFKYRCKVPLHFTSRSTLHFKSRCKVSLHLEGRMLCYLHINERISVYECFNSRLSCAFCVWW